MQYVRAGCSVRMTHDDINSLMARGEGHPNVHDADSRPSGLLVIGGPRMSLCRYQLLVLSALALPALRGGGLGPFVALDTLCGILHKGISGGAVAWTWTWRGAVQRHP